MVSLLSHGLESGHARTECFQENRRQESVPSETPLHRGLLTQLVSEEIMLEVNY